MTAERALGRSFSDDVLDELIPDELDWRDVVVRHPLPALLVAALGGYWLGSRRGDVLTAAAVAFAGQRVDDQVARFFDRDGD